MLAAEKILSRARALVSADNIPADVASKCLGRLDIRMARFVMKKEDKYSSIAAIGAEFVDEINECFKPTWQSFARLAVCFYFFYRTKHKLEVVRL